jgi:hypothetical protein
MSEVKVNKISPRTNCGTTTLGDSGDTFTIPSGVTITNNGTQTGFGRTGTVDWQTSIKTTSFTAVSGEGYFVNTTSGAITVTLPASPSVGDIVAVKDYAQTFDTNKVTIGRNSQPIEGKTFDLILDTEGIAVTLIYGDATKGWQSVNSNEVTNAARFVVATGGTITTSGNFKIHSFTGPGTFTVTCAGNPEGSTAVDYLVIAGGGGGGGSTSSGGAGSASGAGAGGSRTTFPSPNCNAGSFPISVQAYPITVGAGGAAGPGSASPNIPGNNGSNGANSVFSTITAAGGGGGRAGPCGSQNGAPGGSGGGASGGSPVPRSGGSGNTPPVSPPQGNDGGDASHGVFQGAGGGGSGAAGSDQSPSGGTPAPGGAGLANSITGSPVSKASGGTGPGVNTSGGSAGSNGPDNSGDGGPGATGKGGGSDSNYAGGNGGSGIVIIRYKFQ